MADTPFLLESAQFVAAQENATISSELKGEQELVARGGRKYFSQVTHHLRPRHQTRS
jgi:hypothetical protein